MIRLLLLSVVVLFAGCSDFGHYVSGIDFNTGVTGDPSNPDNVGVTVGGKIIFRDTTARRLPNYSKDK